MSIHLYHGDCLDVMASLPDQSMDAVITDPPYGTTACKWDSVIPFAPMWAQLKRLIKPRGAIVLFGSQPFTSALVMSNPAWFRYQWVWNKAQSGNIGLAKYQPLKVTEDILVFSRRVHIYKPDMRRGRYRRKGGTQKPNRIATGIKGSIPQWSELYYPINILNFPNCANKAQRVHPTQKPVALLEYLIKTYTNPGEVVLDFTMGSGTTGVACQQTGRSFIGIERDADYFRIAQERIDAATPLEALDTMPLLSERRLQVEQMRMEL